MLCILTVFDDDLMLISWGSVCRGAEDRLPREEGGRAQRQAERPPGRVFQVAEAVLCADRAQRHAVLLQVC